jgi:Rap1a immunity proteins
MRRLMVALLALAALRPAAARAEQNYGSANHMLPLCKDWLKVAEKDIEAIKSILRREPGRLTAVGMCAGFVVGVSEALRAFELSCPPDGISNEQLVRMVVSEVEKHPELLHEDFIVPTAAVMIAAWPCRK